MSLAAFEQFGVKLEQEQAEPVGWPPVSAETVWLFAQATQVAPANEHARPFPTPPRRRRRFEAKHIWRCVAVLDWLVVVAVAQIAALWGHGQTLAALPLGKAAAIVAGAVALKAGLWLTGAYTAAPARTGPETALGGLALGVIAGLFMAAFAAPDARLAAAFAATLPLAAIALAALHAAAALAVRHAWRRGLFAETAVLVGATPAAERLIERAKALRDLDIVAVIEDRGARAPATLAGAPVAGGVDDLLAWPHLPEIDRIVVCVDHGAHTRVRALLARLQRAPNRLDVLFDYEIAHAAGRRLDRAAGAPLALITGGKPHAARSLAKRAQDIVLGALLTLLFAPVMTLIALAVRLDSPGPALFKQRRHGLNNRVITIWKFRTMVQSACAEPTAQVRPGDARVTRLGGFLRRTSLDELPQLFNVLKGEMSLVGPRPHAIDMRAGEEELSAIAAEYAHRHRVKPGLTGWAQINGSRGPIDTPEAVRRRLALDLDYIAKHSFWLDLWILLRTAPALIGDRKAVR